MSLAGPTNAEQDRPTYAPAADPERFAGAIEAFERADSEAPPSKGGVLFVGSSSIRMWDLDRWFPELEAINRGFGGSHIADSIHFADRIILPYEPSVIVFYAGDNDIAAGLSPEQVYDHYRLFVEKVHEALPEAEIVFLAIKPSAARWAMYPAMRRANDMIRGFSGADDRLSFVDLEPVMLGDDGEPLPELFADDGLHLSDAGYDRWTEALAPYLPGRDAQAEKKEARRE